MKKLLILTLALGLLSASVHAQGTARHCTCLGDTLFRHTCDCGCHQHPVNNYSGLNSLRARLANRSWNGKSELNGTLSFDIDGSLGTKSQIGENSANALGDSTLMSAKDNGNAGGIANASSGAFVANSGMDDATRRYFSQMATEETCIGAPVYLFFALAKATLNDPSQMVNLDVIVSLAKERHLNIRVIGAADSATGTSAGNLALSQARADYIAHLLQYKGVPTDCITIMAEGGIATFTPISANRHVRVELYRQC